MSLLNKLQDLKYKTTIRTLKLFSEDKAFEYYWNQLYKNEYRHSLSPREQDSLVKLKAKIEEMIGLKDSRLINEYVKFFRSLEKVMNVQPIDPEKLQYFILRFADARETPSEENQVLLSLVFEAETATNFKIQKVNSGANYSTMAYNTSRQIFEDFLREAIRTAPMHERKEGGRYTGEDTIPFVVNIAANEIGFRTKRGAGNVIITSKENAKKLARIHFNMGMYKHINRVVEEDGSVDTDYLTYEYSNHGKNVRVYSSNLFDYLKTEVNDDMDFLMLYNGATLADGPFYACIKSIATKDGTGRLIDEYTVMPHKPSETIPDYTVDKYLNGIELP